MKTAEAASGARGVLGARIAVARQEAGLTQKDLADRLHLPLWTLSQLELGGGDPLLHVPAIAEATRRPREWFLPAAESQEQLAEALGALDAPRAVVGRNLVLGAIALLVTIRFFTEVIPVVPRAANFIDIPIFFALVMAALFLPPNRLHTVNPARAYLGVGLPASVFLLLSISSALVNTGRVHPAPVLVFIYGFLAPLVVFVTVYRLWPAGNARALSGLLVALGVLELAVVAAIDLPRFLTTGNPDTISGTFGTNAYQLVFFLLLFTILLAGIITFEPGRRVARYAPMLITASFATILLAQYRALLVSTLVAIVFAGIMIGRRTRGIAVTTVAVVVFLGAFSYIATSFSALRLELAATTLVRDPLFFIKERFTVVRPVSALYGDLPGTLVIGSGPGTFSSRAWQTFANADSTSQSNVVGAYAPRFTGGLYETDVSNKYVRPIITRGDVFQGSRALSQPYSSYLALAAEVGLFGLLLLGGVYFVVVGRSTRVARDAIATADGASAVPALALTAAVGFVTLLQMGLLENWFEVTRVTFVVWAIFGVVAKEVDA